MYKKSSIYFIIIVLITFFALSHLKAESRYNKQRKFFNTYVRNISPSEYKGDSFVWSITEDSSGFTYFASGTKFLCSDGNTVEVYDKDGESVIRHIYYDNNKERIYATGDNFLGYWKRNIYGKLDFTLLHQGNRDIQENIFWRVIPIGEEIYFATHKRLYKYSIEDSKSELILEGDIGYIFNINNELLVQDGISLYKYKGGEFFQIFSGITERIIYIESQGSGNDYLCIGENSGLFNISPYYYKPKQNLKCLASLGGNSLFCATKLKNGNYLLGTTTDGAYLLSPDGDLIKRYNSSANVDFTNILSIFENRMGEIILGADGGYSIISDDSMLDYYFEPSKKMGPIYSAVMWNSKLYLGTSKGLFYENINETSKISHIEGVRGSIWILLSYKDKLLALAGTSLVLVDKNNRARQILSNVRHIEQFYHNPNLLCVADDKGLIVLNMDEDWSSSNLSIAHGKRLFNFKSTYRSFKCDKYGYIWIEDMKGYTSRISLNQDLTNIISTADYKIGENSNINIRIFSIDGELIFTSGKYCYSYNANKDKIELNLYYTNLFSHFNTETFNLTQVGNKIFNYSDYDVIDMLIRNGDEVYVNNNVFMSDRLEHVQKRYRKVLRLDDNNVVCGFFDALGRLNINSTQSPLKYSATNLYKISYLRDDEVHYIPIDLDSYIIPHNAYDLRFYFTISRKQNLQYRVDNQKWSSVPTTEPISIPFLMSGTHKIQIRFNNNIINEVEFKISSPWNLSWWQILSIIFLVVIIYISIWQFLSYRIRVEQKKQDEQRKKELERQNILHQNELLSIAVKEKDSKLAIQTLNNISVNENLNEIVETLIRQADSNKMVNVDIVKRCINKYMREDGNWKQFELYFNNIFDGFLDRLNEKYPKLTNNDIKFCAFIKMGLSTKEIAAILNIKNNSAESARYRLRKNLNIDSNTSLRDIICNI